MNQPEKSLKTSDSSIRTEKENSERQTVDTADSQAARLASAKDVSEAESQRTNQSDGSLGKYVDKKIARSIEIHAIGLDGLPVTVRRDTPAKEQDLLANNVRGVDPVVKKMAASIQYLENTAIDSINLPMSEVIVLASAPASMVPSLEPGSLDEILLNSEDVQIPSDAIAAHKQEMPVAKAKPQSLFERNNSDSKLESLYPSSVGDDHHVTVKVPSMPGSPMKSLRLNYKVDAGADPIFRTLDNIWHSRARADWNEDGQNLAKHFNLYEVRGATDRHLPILKDRHGHDVIREGVYLRNNVLEKDAFIHSMSSAGIAYQFGAASAFSIMTPHEYEAKWTSPGHEQDAADHCMVLYNNWYAAHLGEWAKDHGKSYGWLVARIEKAVRTGELVTHMNRDFYVTQKSNPLGLKWDKKESKWLAADGKEKNALDFWNALKRPE